MQLQCIAKTAIAGAALGFASLAMAAAEINQPAPAFTGKTADGATVNLSAFKGKTVVLEWSNHECPFVKKHYESGNLPAQQKDAAAQGAVWLQVVSSAPGKQGHVDGATAQKLNAGRGAKPAQVILDPEGTIAKQYGAQTTPHLYVIDPKGTLVYKGGIDSIATKNKDDIPKAEQYVKTALASIAAGKPIANPSTKPYGCSVKYAS
ncbi:MAG: alkyl hydroperoxide reductase [Paucimonas sp.]|jgi:streptogramin lyase|nr:alkyl hydroperoxide reductase [Paucimonas sp.]